MVAGGVTGVIGPTGAASKQLGSTDIVEAFLDQQWSTVQPLPVAKINVGCDLLCTMETGTLLIYHA